MRTSISAPTGSDAARVRCVAARLRAVVSTLVAFAGIGVATFYFRRKPVAADALAARFGVVHRLLLHKYYVDELYDLIVVRPLDTKSSRTTRGKTA